MSLLLSSELYALLKEKLNLPDRVRSIKIDMSPQEVVTVTVTRVLDRIEGNALVEAVSKYELSCTDSESLCQMIDRMGDEAKTEIGQMAEKALLKLDVHLSPKATSGDIANLVSAFKARHQRCA